MLTPEFDKREVRTSLGPVLGYLKNRRTDLLSGPPIYEESLWTDGIVANDATERLTVEEFRAVHQGLLRGCIFQLDALILLVKEAIRLLGGPARGRCVIGIEGVLNGLELLAPLHNVLCHFECAFSTYDDDGHEPDPFPPTLAEFDAAQVHLDPAPECWHFMALARTIRAADRHRVREGLREHWEAKAGRTGSQ